MILEVRSSFPLASMADLAFRELTEARVTDLLSTYVVVLVSVLRVFGRYGRCARQHHAVWSRGESAVPPKNRAQSNSLTHEQGKAAPRL